MRTRITWALIIAALFFCVLGGCSHNRLPRELTVGGAFTPESPGSIAWPASRFLAGNGGLR